MSTTTSGVASLYGSHFRTPKAQGAYIAFLSHFNRLLHDLTFNGTKPVFVMRPAGGQDLWEVFINSFTDPDERQYNNCHACRRYIQQFGNLAVLGNHYRPLPLFPGGYTEDMTAARAVSGDFFKAIKNVHEAVARGTITSVFYTDQARWGTSENDGWHHFHADAPRAMVQSRRAAFAPDQLMARSREDHRTLTAALQEIRPETIRTILNMIALGSLYRGDKIKPQAEWLLELLTYKSSHRVNRIWYAVASAPAGWCAPRSSVLGSLIEDLQSGFSPETAASRFAAKLNPLQYQRPQAAPKAGTILTAQRRFEQLGLEPALKRRAAHTGDVQEWVWKPSERPTLQQPQRTGLFSDLTPAAPEPAGQKLPARRPYTWVKFSAEILPTVAEIRFVVPTRGPFGAFTTACDPFAPPILQWDRSGCRNPVAWYQYIHGSYAVNFGLNPQQPSRVLGITKLPPEWNGGNYPHFAKGVLIVLERCHDTGSPDLALFPEILRSDLHEVRSVIEAYSKKNMLQKLGVPLQHAAGILIRSGEYHGGYSGYKLHVTFKNGDKAEFTISAWD